MKKSYQGKNVYVGINLTDTPVVVDKLAVTGKGYKDAYADSKVTEADGTVSFTIPALKAGGTIILGVQEETIEPDKDIEANAITLNKTDLTLKKGNLTP